MNSIRARLLIWQIGALLLTSLLASALTYEMAWRGFNRVRDYGLEQIAYSIMRHDTQDWLDDAPDAQDASRSDSAANPTRDSDPSEDLGQFVSQIWSPNGRLIYSSLTDTGPPLQQPGLHRASWDGTNWRIFTLVDRDRMIQVATTTEHRLTAFAEFIPWLLAPLALLLVLLGFFIRTTVTGALSPLRQLRSELQSRDVTQLTPVDPTNMPEEIVPLVETLNQLLAQVDNLLATQRQFLADVAHELNTPLAAIKLQAQLAQRVLSQSDEGALDELQAGIERSVHLVAQLLQMARLEPDARKTEPTMVDLGRLARDRVTAFSAQADQRDIDLGLEASPVEPVMGDPNALRVLLDNLIDNALRYGVPTAGGGRHVTVEIAHDPRTAQVVLSVLDNGPGITEAQRARVLSRWGQGSAGEALKQGSGLGLAIVSEYARILGATLTLGAGEDGADGGRGLKVSLAFAGQPKVG